MIHQEKSAYITVLAIVVGFLTLALLNFLNIFYDTMHSGDTGFILGAAWRVYNGLEPAIDFGHFYGGFTASLVAVSMRLFGADVFALEVTFLLSALGASMCAVIICRGHVSRMGLGLICLLIVTLLVTRHPLEVDQSITQLVSAHSFLYNRLGLVAVVLCGLYVALVPRGRGQEVLAGALVGTALVAAAFTKPTFIILIPAVLVGLTLQRRWLGLASCGAGVLVTMGIVDPLATQLRASFAYISASVGERGDAQITSLIRKAVQVPLAQPLALVVVIAGLIHTLRQGRVFVLPIVALVLVAVAGIGMAASMGGGGSLGQLALPIFCMILIVLRELVARQNSEQVDLLQLLSLMVMLAFALPHLANLAGVTLESYIKRDTVRIERGPYAGYLNVPEGADPERANQYDMLVDGITTLQTLGDHSARGIIADSHISFEFPLRAKPVPGFPLWPRAHSPEFAPDRPTPAEVDLILLATGALADATLGPVLRRWLSDDFVLCQRSHYWDIFARLSTAPQTCAEL